MAEADDQVWQSISCRGTHNRVVVERTECFDRPTAAADQGRRQAVLGVQARDAGQCLGQGSGPRRSG